MLEFLPFSCPEDDASHFLQLLIHDDSPEFLYYSMNLIIITTLKVNDTVPHSSKTKLSISYRSLKIHRTIMPVKNLFLIIMFNEVYQSNISSSSSPNFWMRNFEFWSIKNYHVSCQFSIPTTDWIIRFVSIYQP